MEALKNPLLIFGLPLLLITLHTVAILTGIYGLVNHFDSIMHFVGGVVSAVSVLGILAYAIEKDWIKIDDQNVSRLLVIGMVALIALAWELFELGFDAYFGTHWQPSIRDSLKDQVLGVFGAVMVVLKLRV
ncbi:MAG: hypothetical protein V3V50_00010 [Gammaproteobacteria bacterium]